MGTELTVTRKAERLLRKFQTFQDTGSTWSAAVDEAVSCVATAEAEEKGGGSLMRELEAPDEWISITGRGRLAIYSKRQWSPPPRVGEHILIDGVEYQIKGLEQWAISSMGTDSYYDYPREGAFLVHPVEPETPVKAPESDGETRSP